MKVPNAYMSTVRIFAGQSRLFQIYQQQCPAKTSKKGEKSSFFMLSVRINVLCPAKFEALSSYSFDRGWAGTACLNGQWDCRNMVHTF